MLASASRFDGEEPLTVSIFTFSPDDRGEIVSMGKYILKRVLHHPGVLGVTLILFALQNIVPGDPIKLIGGGGKAMTPEAELNLRIRYNLVQVDENGHAILDENGDPVPVPMLDRYVTYITDLFHGDLGESYQRKMEVTDILSSKYPYTIKLAICAIVLEAIMGVGAGIISQ